MRVLSVLFFGVLMGCDVGGDYGGGGGANAETRAIISARDMAMNRPNTATAEAVFRLLPNGTGTVRFIANPDGAQAVEWSLTGDNFCIDAHEGLMASFDCATLSVRGAEITLAHTQSDNVATGRLVPR